MIPGQGSPLDKDPGWSSDSENVAEEHRNVFIYECIYKN